MTTEFGRTAYEARFAGEKQGPRGTVDPWEMLPDSTRAIWRRVEEASQRHPASQPDAVEAPRSAQLHGLLSEVAQHFVFDPEGDLTNEEFDALNKRITVALAKPPATPAQGSVVGAPISAKEITDDVLDILFEGRTKPWHLIVSHLQVFEKAYWRQRIEAILARLTAPGGGGTEACPGISEHVHEHEGLWWFWDEAQTNRMGGCKTRDGLLIEMGRYCELLTPSEPAKPSAPGLAPERKLTIARENAERVCHEEQMTVWTGEIAGRLSMGGYLRDNLSYDGALSLRSDMADEIRSIVESAFSHPELEALTPSDGQVGVPVKRTTSCGLRLHVEQGRAGLWYITSPDRPGLFVTGSTEAEARLAVTQVIADLDTARTEPLSARPTATEG